MTTDERVLKMPKRVHRRQPGDAKPLGEPGESLTIKEAAAEMRCSVATMREQINRRRLEVSKPFGKILVPRSEIQRLKDETKIPALPARRA
jgi:excisionase family DNA binding protein